AVGLVLENGFVAEYTDVRVHVPWPSLRVDRSPAFACDGPRTLIHSLHVARRKARRCGRSFGRTVMLSKSVMCVLALGTGSVPTAAWTARIREVARAPSAPAPLVRPNANIERAGVLHDGVLAVTLEAKESAFLIDGPHRRPMTVAA